MHDNKIVMYHSRRKELTFKGMNKLNGVWREKGWRDWKGYGKNGKNRKIGKTEMILGYKFHHQELSQGP